jgi:hypothetical protein
LVSIPAEYREAIVVRFQDELAWEEIAMLIGSLGKLTFKTRLRKNEKRRTQMSTAVPRKRITEAFRYFVFALGVFGGRMVDTAAPVMGVNP